MRRGTGYALTAGVLAACLCQVAWGAPLLGNSFDGTDGAVLYSVDPLRGQVSEPRSTGIQHLVGVAFGSDGTLFGLSAGTASSGANALYEIDPATGASAVIGSTGVDNIVEGDLAVDPTTGTLYGMYHLAGDNSRRLLTLDTLTGQAAPLTNSLFGDPSAMAFDAGGNLYVIDVSLDKLLQVDKTSGAILSTVDLGTELGSVAGMAVDPDTGVFYVADGGSLGSDNLYTLNPATGVVTLLGPTGTATGLAGLAFVPEPGTAALVGAALLALVRCRRRGGRVTGHGFARRACR